MAEVVLAKMKCTACEGGTPPMEKKEIEENLKKVGGWEVVDGNAIKKTYNFKDFRQALDYTNKIGEIAEDEGHHPDITLSWGKVQVRLTTHAVGGLSMNDFILAAKYDEAI